MGNMKYEQYAIELEQEDDGRWVADGQWTSKIRAFDERWLTYKPSIHGAAAYGESPREALHRVLDKLLDLRQTVFDRESKREKKP